MAYQVNLIFFDAPDDYCSPGVTSVWDDLSVCCIFKLKLQEVFWGAVSVWLRGTDGTSGVEAAPVSDQNTWMLASAQARALKLIFHDSMWL